MAAETRTIKTEALARVEGEGALHLKLVDGRAQEVRLEIYEPPRFFEGLLKGRRFDEAPDITARICGICPVAYQTSAMLAMEDAAGVEVPEGLRHLRRLLYCGEWLQSHALHVFLLHAPDFFGLDDGFALAERHGDLVRRGLEIKRTGNAILEVVGGRAVHPVNPRVGGFWRAPTRAELAPLRPKLEEARAAALATLAWTATLSIPELERDPAFLAVHDPDGYALDRGTLHASTGAAFTAREWDDHVVEVQVAHSTALHATLDGASPYLTGPLARWALNGAQLPQWLKDAAAAAGLAMPCRNPFGSIQVRAAEMAWAADEALRLIDAYEPPATSFVEVAPRDAEGFGVSEAPRGALHHGYAVDGDGLITRARIVPPTSQNQAAIEADVKAAADAAAALDDAALAWRCEQAIRNHDPCISCSTHFLTVTVERG
jgi:coenzyme F420-reducing hydrogenase alpha subunit